MIKRHKTDLAAFFAVLFLVLGFAACTSDENSATTTAAAEDGSDDQAGDGTSGNATAVANTSYLDSYTLMDEEFGTMVTVSVDGETRSIQTNAIPDHETGEFPNDGNPNTITEQDLSYEYPTEGVYTGSTTFAMVPGVAVNGVSFEPGTGESVTCESGENYRIEALQDLYNLGLDFNNAHVQPGGKYHYHGLSELLVEAYETDEDLVHVGFAADGFLIYYSKSEAYSSGYELSDEARTGTDCLATGPGNERFDIDGTTPDGTYGSDWVHGDDNGDLDSCNGTEINGEYAYIITNEYPYISRCLNGEFTATGPGGAPPGDGAAPEDGEAPNDGAAAADGPDLGEAAEALGVTEQELMNALGAPPPDLEAAAEQLGVTVEELEAVLPAPPAG